MKTPITYYGGKQVLAQRIISMIPKHRLYVEPFFGGGAVFFAKKPSKVEVINDINDKLMTFYLQLQANHEKLIQTIKNTLHFESLSKVARDIYNKRIKHDDLDMAWAVWILTNGCFTGSPHGSWKWCNGYSGSHTGKVLANKRSRLSNSLYERLKYVQISSRDALRVIADRDTPETVYFLDPPYPGANQKHYRGYSHKEFYKLLQLISGIKGRFILTNYWCQTLKYHVLKYGWDYSTFHGHIVVNRIKANRGPQTPVKKEEVIVTNFKQPKTDYQQIIDGNYILIYPKHEK